MTVVESISVLSVAAWIYLLAGRGAFWRVRERDDLTDALRDAHRGPWPSVVAVVPARDEADVIGRSIASLLRQDYPGRFRIVVVDDQSGDGTGDVVRSLGEKWGANDRLEIVAGRVPPGGWMGKVWALQQGVARARCGEECEFLLLTDADIEHAPDNLRRLVSRSSAGGLVCASLMARLRCESAAERALIPAFVFFFAMLFPFRWVNRPRNGTAAAAGGCMLVRRAALEAIGGIASIRGEIIDDCGLARRLKAYGPVWLGLSNRAVSLRRYDGAEDISRMVARSAYAQLRYSPLLLVGTVLAFALTFWVPPVVTVFGSGDAQLAASAAWGAMAVAFQPMLRLYRLSPVWGAVFPAIAVAYVVFTLQSAIQHWRGRGGMWKGRAPALQ